MRYLLTFDVLDSLWRLRVWSVDRKSSVVTEIDMQQPVPRRRLAEELRSCRLWLGYRGQ